MDPEGTPLRQDVVWERQQGKVLQAIQVMCVATTKGTTYHKAHLALGTWVKLGV